MVRRNPLFGLLDHPDKERVFFFLGRGGVSDLWIRLMLLSLMQFVGRHTLHGRRNGARSKHVSLLHLTLPPPPSSPSSFHRSLTLSLFSPFFLCSCTRTTIDEPNTATDTAATTTSINVDIGTASRCRTSSN